MDLTVVQDTLDLFPVRGNLGIELKAMEFEAELFPLRKADDSELWKRSNGSKYQDPVTVSRKKYDKVMYSEFEIPLSFLFSASWATFFQ